ncbi:MAG: NAD(P)-dependent glycerol-3-phosphate dehydrogenase [Erysipelotrichales bacterium]|nr:NAD(P)-dependent glycerol-3-phosphate dehydrogenase [Erysipelotrichales bacterium]
MNVTVIGAGAWGTALAQQAASNGNECVIIGRDPEVIRAINTQHRNPKYFPDTILDSRVTGSLSYDCLKGAEAVILAVPSRQIEEVTLTADRYADRPEIWICAAKGFFPHTKERMSQVIKRCVSKDHCAGIVSLIGPSFAEEVVKGGLTAIDAVSEDQNAARTAQLLFSNETFRVYTGSDLIGAETASSMKNIIAIAAGMAAGRGLGHNALAGLITRGLAEITRFGAALGGNPKSFLGLSGVGDLVLTCTSKQSRNFSAGYMIGKEDSAEGFWKNNRKTVEGVSTCEVLYEYAKELGVELPITNEMYEVLFRGAKPSESIDRLMRRELKAEEWSSKE